MSNPFSKKIFQVSRTEIGYLRFITESYDGLVFLRTLDPKPALVEISYPAERENDATGLLTALGNETNWEDVTELYAGKFPSL